MYILFTQEDKLPMLVNNRMGHVTMNEMLQITPDMLLAKPMDGQRESSDDIVYTLVPPVNNPMEGMLCRCRQHKIVTDYWYLWRFTCAVKL